MAGVFETRKKSRTQRELTGSGQDKINNAVWLIKSGLKSSEAQNVSSLKRGRKNKKSWLSSLFNWYSD